jgi:hypothetical protein
MNLTCEQLGSDRIKMVRFICERIPADGARVILADGNDGPVWADLDPSWVDEGGWDLRIETNEPEWVGLKKVYDHFRRQETTWGEWSRGVAAEMQRWKHRITPKESDDGKLNTQIVDGKELPKEISTAEAARILGISKDSVLKLKEAGLLEYRNTATPDSSRPVFAFSLQSVLEVRTTYKRDMPIYRRPHDPNRHPIKEMKKYEHLKLTPD